MESTLDPPRMDENRLSDRHAADSSDIRKMKTAGYWKVGMPCKGVIVLAHLMLPLAQVF